MTRTPANRADPAITEALHSEEGWISVHHRFHGFTQHKQRIGLALPGGGIRSATFSLGVLQVLSRQGMIPHVDYLSTVSGGSYIGAFFGALYVDPMHRNVDEPEFDDKARREFAAMPLQSTRGRMAVARLRSGNGDT